jgi:hypothetical protein
MMKPFSQWHDILEEKHDTIREFLLNPEFSEKDLTALVDDFKVHGGSVLGNGAFGRTFYHPSWSHVLKIFPHDDCYIKFVRFAYRNHHPSFPRFYDLPRQIVPMFSRYNHKKMYMVRVELLGDIPDRWGLGSDIDDMKMEYLKYRLRGEASVDFKEMLKGMDHKVLVLLDGMWLIKKNLPNCELDIHGGNIMERPDTGDYVWIDPVWYGRESGLRNAAMSPWNHEHQPSRDNGDLLFKGGKQRPVGSPNRSRIARVRKQRLQALKSIDLD